MINLGGLADRTAITDRPRSESYFVPVPGVPGKDGAVVAFTKQIHTQRVLSDRWIINTGLDYPVTAVHIMVDGDPVIAPWTEVIAGRIVIDFTKPAIGTVYYS